MSEPAEINPPAWRRYLSYLAVALMPLSFNIEKLLKGDSSHEPVYFSPLDILLPILTALALCDILKNRPWARLKLPPVAGMLWTGIAVLSCLWIAHFFDFSAKDGGEIRMGWLKDIVKTPLFFTVLAAWVFQNMAGTAEEFRRLTLILLASFGVCVLIAVKQYAGPPGIPFDPGNPGQDLGGVTNIRLGGWYDFRGVFGAQAAMLLPAAAAFALCDRDSSVRAAAAALCVAGLCVTLAAAGFAGACAGFVAVAAALFAARGHLYKGLLALGILVAVVALIVPRLPRHNADVLLRGFALYADDNGVKRPTARLRRYQAALDLLGAPSIQENPQSAPYWIKGAGAGRFQKTIVSFYQPPYNRPGRRTDDEAAMDMDQIERFTFGFLETQTVELGVAGLAAVLLLFGVWIFSVHGVFAVQAPDSIERILALASLGAGCGALVLSIFANPLIRGPGGSFAFFFALAMWLKHRNGGKHA